MTAAKKAAEVAATKVGKKVGEKAAAQATNLAEKESAKLQQILRKCKPAKGKITSSNARTTTVGRPTKWDTMLMLNQILANQL